MVLDEFKGPDQGRSGASSQVAIEVQGSSFSLVERMLVRMQDKRIWASEQSKTNVA